MEYIYIVDENNRIIGKASRKECHGDPSLIHRTVHVVVYHPDGRILLQKRNMDKDIQPGKWDTAVGGHVDLGEDFDKAVRRELAEELGVHEKVEFQHIFDSKIRNDIESENVRVYSIIHPGPFDFQKDEIAEVRFWEICELRKIISETPEIFTPNVSLELKKLFS
jgi:isopentenyldiphosphate isomerase